MERSRLSARTAGRVVAIGLLTTLLGMGVALASEAGKASAAAPQALILGSTVTPGTATDGSGVSLEQQQAQADGFTVTVVDDATWSTMTAAQFAAYQVIIIGDPTCGNTVQVGSVAQSNASVWEPVVMNSGGNKVLVGTDPTFHNNGPSGTQRGDVLEANGIAFAGAVLGATGAYVDLSCTYDSTPAGTPVPILDGLSTLGPGQFTAVGEGAVNACATGVNVVAQSGPTTGLTDAELSNWGCSVHEAFDKFPADYTPLALAPSSSGFPSSYCANDMSAGSLACGSPYVMVSGSGITVSSDISLAGATQPLPLGSSATLTATVTHGGVPEAGKTVSFSVNSGPNTGATGTAATDSAGHATFAYVDRNGAGIDGVSASFVNDAGAAEQATTSVTWSATASGAPKIVALGPPVVSGSTRASFSSTVNPSGLPTSAHFEYGLDARYRGNGASGIVYDQSTPAQAVGSDQSPHFVSASVSGLIPNALYHVRLVASNSSGTVFGGDQTFTTATDPAPPKPVLGKEVNVKPVSGLVFIRPPAGKSLGQFSGALARAALAKGQGFVPLTEARQIPTGSQIDARQGSLQVTTASVLRRGKPQIGTFGGGLFNFTQARTRVSKGLSTLSLLEGAFPGAPTYASCTVKARKAAASAHGQAVSAVATAHTARLSNRVLQTLRASVHGHFRTRGRFSAGTARGTQWGTQDQCNGTLTVVRRGTVEVRDFVARKTIAVHAGHRYLAKAITTKHKHK